MNATEVLKNPPRKFEGTSVTNLALEANTGVYYLLARVKGRPFKRSLKTTSFTAAKEALTAELAKIREALDQGVQLTSGQTVGEFAALWIKAQEDAVEAKELSTKYLEASLRSCLKKIW